MSESKEVQVLPEQDMTASLTVVSQMADVLGQFIRSNGLTTNFRGKEHVNVEAWEFLFHLRGESPVTVSTEKLEDGAIKANVCLVKDDTGMQVGAAEALCGGPKDTNWKSRGDEVCTSMAITRAVGKIGRMKYGFVMKRAGFEATPSEEMPSQQPKSDLPFEKEPDPMDAMHAVRMVYEATVADIKATATTPQLNTVKQRIRELVDEGIFTEGQTKNLGTIVTEQSKKIREAAK